jgi:hypothetical protein
VLDPTSQILVFEVLKHWHNIIITHDLSQIDPKDFLYALKNRSVIKQGSRYNLKAEHKYAHNGEGIRDSMEMLKAQCMGGFCLEKSPFEPSESSVDPLSSSEETVHALSSDSNDEDEDDVSPKLLFNTHQGQHKVSTSKFKSDPNPNNQTCVDSFSNVV